MSETFQRLHGAFAAELKACKPEDARALALLLSQMAEIAHPGPWSKYLADVCGLQSVPDEWREIMGRHVQCAWGHDTTVGLVKP